jgi:Ribosomal L27e protein family
VSPQTFIKVVNYQHMMPTRYTLDVDLKSAVPADVLDQEDKKDEARRVRACTALSQHALFSPASAAGPVLDIRVSGHHGQVHQLASHSVVSCRRPRTCCSRSLPPARTGGSLPSCGSEVDTVRCGLQPRHDGALRTLGLKTQPVGRTASVATSVQRVVRAVGPSGVVGGASMVHPAQTCHCKSRNHAHPVSTTSTLNNCNPPEQAVSSILDLLRQEAELLCLWCAVQSEALCSSLPCRCAGCHRCPQLEDCLKGHFPFVCICIRAEV